MPVTEGRELPLHSTIGRRESGKKLKIYGTFFIMEGEQLKIKCSAYNILQGSAVLIASLRS